MAHTTPVAARSLRRDRSHPPYTGMSRLSDFACPLLIDDSLRPSAWVQTRAASVLRGAVANTAVVDGFSPYMEQTSSPAGWSQKFRIAHKVPWFVRKRRDCVTCLKPLRLVGAHRIGGQGAGGIGSPLSTHRSQTGSACGAMRSNGTGRELCIALNIQHTRLANSAYLCTCPVT